MNRITKQNKPTREKILYESTDIDYVNIICVMFVMTNVNVILETESSRSAQNNFQNKNNKYKIYYYQMMIPCPNSEEISMKIIYKILHINVSHYILLRRDTNWKSLAEKRTHESASQLLQLQFYFLMSERVHTTYADDKNGY